MKNRFHHPKSKVCVAVKFDETGRAAVKVAEQFCIRTGASLHLVHVCENILVTNMVTLSTMAPIPVDLLQTTQDTLETVAESEMNTLAKSISPTIKVSTSVSSGTGGTPAELIEAEALSNSCTLIVVGTSATTHRFVPRGLSCALTLMSTSKLPVMIVNKNQTQDLAAGRLQLTIADDLKSPSSAAVSGGFELAIAFAKTDIHHIYINGITVETLQATFQSALAASHAKNDATISAEDVYGMMIKNLEKKLESRTTDLNTSIELSSCRYHAAVVTSQSVTECLEKVIQERKSNLTVFGRHQWMHHKPFSIGQMPFYAMLNLHCPIVVFPPA